MGDDGNHKDSAVSVLNEDKALENWKDLLGTTIILSYYVFMEINTTPGDRVEAGGGGG